MADKSEASLDQAVLDLLVKVEKKKEEIKKAKVRPVWKTSCSFGRDPASAADRTNIQTVRETRKLVEIYAFLSIQQDELEKAANELGVVFDETWQGYTISDWKSDIKTRCGQLSLEQKEKDLEALDKKVNNLVTIEQRREMEVKALQQMLKD